MNKASEEIVHYRFFKKMYAHPILLILAVMALTVPAVIFIFFITIDNDVRSFIPKDEPVYVLYETLNETYGSGDLVLIGLERKYETFANASVLMHVVEFTEAIQRMDVVEEVLSLTNSVVFSSLEGGIGSEQVFPSIPESSSEIQKRLMLLNAWEATESSFLSPSQRSAQIFVGIRSGLSVAERRQLYDDLLVAASSLEQLPDMTVHITGEPILNATIGRNMLTDVSTLLPLVILVMGGLLILFFRRIGGVLFPLITVAISVVWTLGLMSIFSRPLTLIGSVIPVILVAVGSAYGIHYVHMYYQKLNQGLSRKDAVFATLRTVGLPIILAALTTLVGFSSLSITKLVPMRDFGIFTALGVLLSVVILFMLVPSIHLLGGKSNRTATNASHSTKKLPLTSFFFSLYRLVLKERFFILFGAVLLIILSFFGIRNIVVDNNVIEYFPPQSEIAEADTFFAEEFQGTRSFNINVIGAERGDIVKPQLLIAMDELKKYLMMHHPQISTIRSFTDFVKRINQVIQTSALAEEAPIVESVEDELPSFFVQEAPLISSSSTRQSEGYPEEDIDELFTSLFSTLNSADQVDEVVYDAIYQLAVELNYQGLQFYEIPSDPDKYAVIDETVLEDLIAQYLFLFSGSMSAWVDNDFTPQSARMVVQMTSANAVILESIQEDIHNFASYRFPPGYKVEVSGTAFIEQRLTDIILESQILSIIVSMVAVIIILWVSFRSLSVGLLGVIPVILSLLSNFAVMGWFGITLDISTAMVASCAIGIGIDYAIHYLSTYKDEYFSQSKNEEELELRVFRRTGGAIFFNAFSVAGGFLALTLSQFLPLRNLGLLVALSMLMAGCTTVTILPVLLGLLSPSKIFRVKENI